MSASASNLGGQLLSDIGAIRAFKGTVNKAFQRLSPRILRILKLDFVRNHCGNGRNTKTVVTMYSCERINACCINL